MATIPIVFVHIFPNPTPLMASPFSFIYLSIVLDHIRLIKVSPFSIATVIEIGPAHINMGMI